MVAFPDNVAVMVEAEKLPEPSLATMALLVFADTAVVAELDTFPEVEMTARLASVIPAVPDRLELVRPEMVLEAAAMVLLDNVSLPARVASVPEVGSVTEVVLVDVSVVL